MASLIGRVVGKASSFLAPSASSFLHSAEALHPTAVLANISAGLAKPGLNLGHAGDHGPAPSHNSAGAAAGAVQAAAAKPASLSDLIIQAGVGGLAGMVPMVGVSIWQQKQMDKQAQLQMEQNKALTQAQLDAQNKQVEQQIVLQYGIEKGGEVIQQLKAAGYLGGPGTSTAHAPAFALYSAEAGHAPDQVSDLWSQLANLHGAQNQTASHMG